MAEVLSTLGHAPLRSSASHTSFFDAHQPYATRPRRSSASTTDLRRAALSSSSQSGSSRSSRTSSSSSLSLRSTGFVLGAPDSDSDSSEDDGLVFPAYATGTRRQLLVDQARTAPPPSPVGVGHPPSSPAEPADSNNDDDNNTEPLPVDPVPHCEDDSAVRVEPSHHVDYLSYEWKEEDIWSSWRHIVERRKVYGERSRLENASWRTWAKAQFQLRTVSPETLNWSKDCDVTWLYGPLQPASNRSASQNPSEPPSRLSKNNSFLHKKPILKKRSMSEVMLQNSISASSLVKQAAAAVQAQQRQRASGTPLERRRYRPMLGQVMSDFGVSAISSRSTSRDPTDYFSSRSSNSSGVQSPDHGERKHIRFDDKVEQCIAVECKDDDDDGNPWPANDADSSDDGVVMMKRSRKKRTLSRTNSRSNVHGESKIIAKLPSTTLKYKTDAHDASDQHLGHSLFGFYRSNRLSPSPSQETIRPSNPSTNFLIPGDDDDETAVEEDWDPSCAFEVKRPGTPGPQKHNQAFDSGLDSDSDSVRSTGMRRTPSGMFMPFEENDDEDTAPPGIIGRVVDTVNTARDIAHVIWNVGWPGRN